MLLTVCPNGSVAAFGDDIGEGRRVGGTSCFHGIHRRSFSFFQTSLSCKKYSSFRGPGPPTTNVGEYTVLARPKNLVASDTHCRCSRRGCMFCLSDTAPHDWSRAMLSTVTQGREWGGAVGPSEY